MLKTVALWKLLQFVLAGESEQIIEVSIDLYQKMLSEQFAYRQNRRFIEYNYCNSLG